MIARHDYHPFGEEVATSQRTTELNYSGDSVRKKFTGYERDGETGDDFAEARYYNSRLARFNSVDPLMASAEISLPQTFNRYAYVTNNPLNLTDPTGMVPECPSGQTCKKTECPSGQTCKKDDKGNEYYLNGKGEIVYVGAVGVVTVVAEAVKEAVKVTIREPRWYEMWWYYTKKAATNTGKGVLTIGKLGGAAITILLNPTSTGCGASPGMGSDGNGGCVQTSPIDPIVIIDTSANPNPADNAPNTDVSKSPTLSKKRTERPDTGIADLPDAEISRRARDRSLPGPVRKKYQKEDKIRGNRNKQKRKNK